MGKRRLILGCVIATGIFLFFRAGYAQDSKDAYYAGIEAAKSGDLDAAFMYFQSIASGAEEPKYKPDALFATGEYYFAKGDYHDADDSFVKVVGDYPDSKASLFSLVYLLKIAELKGNTDYANDLKNRILNFKQQIFVFKNSKEYKYQSGLCNKYKAVYYIDKIEFYLGGHSFAQISY